jgi:hypothetical protein
MATNSGSGSILLKVVIGLLVLVLILIIKIPDSIWTEEAYEKSQSHFNISSIYEAEKHYHRLTQNFTTDKTELLTELKKDSTLFQTQKLVGYTVQLRNTINKYLSNELVGNLLNSYQTIQTIIQDLATNERFFKIDPAILNKSDDLHMKSMSFFNEMNYPNLAKCYVYLDTLYQLRRDLSDYNLQTAAAMALTLTENSNSYLGGIELEKFISEWNVLNTDLTDFRTTIKNSDISKNTSVGDRLKEFTEKINLYINNLKALNVSGQSQAAVEINTNLEGLYEIFLKDFIITSKHGLYKLTLEDSMVLYIAEENFFSPVTGDPYYIFINDDSTDVKVESPVLVEELIEKSMPLATQIAGLDFLDHYKEYADSLQKVFKKSSEIRGKIRLNLEITVKNKEVEEKVNKYLTSSEFTAVLNLMHFVDVAQQSKSYSQLKENIENARNAIGIFEQVYGENMFGNIDSLHSDLKKDLEEYNSLLDNVKRLPTDINKFEEEVVVLDRIVDKMKTQSASTNQANLKNLQEKLESVLLFAAKGRTERVYGVFEKTIQNYGYVYHNTKSWEKD